MTQNNRIEIHDESVLGDLFEDFDSEDKNIEKTENKRKSAGIKTIILILILFIIGVSYYLFLVSKTNNVTSIQNQGNGNSSEIVNIMKEETKQQEEKNEIKNDFSKKEVLKYNEFAPLMGDKSWGGNDESKFSDTWGEENIVKLSGTALQINYPKGSYKPSIDPRGGAGFVFSMNESYKELTLVYEVEFADNFDFVKGGKLPGLCGGNCARGISGQDEHDGFSVRLAWRKNGYFDAIVNYPGSSQFGDYLGMKSLKFEAGKKYLIMQKITLNSPGKNDGKLELSINGKNVYIKNDISYRTKSDISIDGLLFSTFFGGNDISYATPVDTYINFDKFSINQ